MMTLITEDRLKELVRLAGETPDGPIAEVGVYKGGSLKILADHFPNRQLYGFDTFQGLPKEHWNKCEVHQPGDFADTSFAEVADLFANYNHVMLVKGLFPESAYAFEMQYSFVHIDTDFYLSVKACIEWFWPRLAVGGIMVFDDYNWPRCPGVKQALDESGLNYNATYAAYQACITKLTA